MADSVSLADQGRQDAEPRRAWLRHPATLAAAGFLVVRAIGLLSLVLAPARGSRPLIEVLGIWDGGWYVRIAESGYAAHLDLSAPAIDQSTGSLAFFPAYPTLMRVVSQVTGLDPRWAGVLISLVAGAMAAAGVAVLATDWASRRNCASRRDWASRRNWASRQDCASRQDWASRRVGLLAGLLWTCAPAAVVGTLVYTETLFTAFAVWAFIALRREQWILAGFLGFSAGLTRPTGIAVGVAIAVYAVWTWRQHSRARAPSENRRSPLPLVAGALALSGTPAFWLWVGLRAGRWDGWFAVQDAFWTSHFDAGASVLTLAKTVLLGESATGSGLMNAAVLGCLLAALVLFAMAIRERVWWPLLVYAGVSMVMVIGSAGYASSKLRFLVPIFVLAFPLARSLGTRGWVTQTLVVLGAVATTTLSGGLLLLVWPYAI